MICKLCNQNKQLQKSHIIPKFVGNYLKRSSATGYLRHASNPNQRVQDIWTEYMLCSDCENLFSRWEKLFAENIFLPYHEQQQTKFKYDNWLLMFAISLSFRVAVDGLDNFNQEYPQLVTKVTEAIADWKRTLLTGASPKRYKHHLFFLNKVEPGTATEIPGGLHWYTFSGVSKGVLSNGTEVFTAVQIPGMLLISNIFLVQPYEFTRTEIHQTGKISTTRQIIRHSGVYSIIQNGIIAVRDFQSNISDSQRQRVIAALQRDPARTASSRTQAIADLEEYWQQQRILGNDGS